MLYIVCTHRWEKLFGFSFRGWKWVRKCEKMKMSFQLFYEIRSVSKQRRNCYASLYWFISAVNKWEHFFGPLIHMNECIFDVMKIYGIWMNRSVKFVLLYIGHWLSKEELNLFPTSRIFYHYWIHLNFYFVKFRKKRMSGSELKFNFNRKTECIFGMIILIRYYYKSTIKIFERLKIPI